MDQVISELTAQIFQNAKEAPTAKPVVADTTPETEMEDEKQDEKQLQDMRERLAGL